MKKILSKITWENFIIYSLFGILALGLVLFLIGYMWNFKLNLEGKISDLFPEKLSLYHLMKNESLIEFINTTNNISIDTKNIFTFMGSINNNIIGYDFAALSISGFAFIMFSLLIILILLFTIIFIEYIYPKFKKKK